MMAVYRRKPTCVEAEQWFEGKQVSGVKHGLLDLGEAGFYVTTIHGQRTRVVDGDWIITEPDGIHHYPCKPDIFEATYEATGLRPDEVILPYASQAVAV